ncbi:MAG: NHL repeat-containing protein [Ardenticatenia bacterium]|nr:NHL repeat-containing protein [Ardenticatenia bacterium]
MAFAPDGRLVVADSNNNRIHVLDVNGEVITTFGEPGSAPGQFNEPWGVAVDGDGNIYVADTWNHRIQKFAPDGTFLKAWGTFADTQGTLEQPGAFWGPRGIFVTDDGRVLVADTGNKRVQVFDTEGTFLGMFGGRGSEHGKMDEPTSVAVGPDGTIYVADTWNQRVQAFGPDFSFLRQWPVAGWRGQSVLNKPAIATDGRRVWVSDPEAHRLVEFDIVGNVLRVWGRLGSDATSLNLPLGLAYRDGLLAVADSNNNRVQLFNVGP